MYSTQYDTSAVTTMGTYTIVSMGGLGHACPRARVSWIAHALQNSETPPILPVLV